MRTYLVSKYEPVLLVLIILLRISHSKIPSLHQFLKKMLSIRKREGKLLMDTGKRIDSGIQLNLYRPDFNGVSHSARMMYLILAERATGKIKHAVASARYNKRWKVYASHGSITGKIDVSRGTIVARGVIAGAWTIQDLWRILRSYKCRKLWDKQFKRLIANYVISPETNLCTIELKGKGEFGIGTCAIEQDHMALLVDFGVPSPETVKLKSDYGLSGCVLEKIEGGISVSVVAEHKYFQPEDAGTFHQPQSDTIPEFIMRIKKEMVIRVAEIEKLLYMDGASLQYSCY